MRAELRGEVRRQRLGDDDVAADRHDPPPERRASAARVAVGRRRSRRVARIAPRDVSTTDRPSAWRPDAGARGRPRGASPRRPPRGRRGPRRAWPGGARRSARRRARRSTRRCRSRSGGPIAATTCAGMPTPRSASTAPSKRGRVRGRRGEHDVAGAARTRRRSAVVHSALDVLEGLDRLAVERLGALDAVELARRGQRLLESRVAEAAVAGRGAPADPLGLEQDDARPELGRATGRGQPREPPADDHDVGRVREVAAAPVGQRRASSPARTGAGPRPAAPGSRPSRPRVAASADAGERVPVGTR